MSFILACAFIIFGLLRWCTTCGAIWWLRTNGVIYHNSLQHIPSSALTGLRLREILDTCGGARVFPWGVLEYKLQGRNSLWRFFGRRIYRLPTLPLLAIMTYMLVGFNGDKCSHIAWSVVATIYQICIILSALEAIYSYIAIGGYRRYYQVGIRLSDSGKPNTKDDMYELDVILPLGLSAISINVLAVMVAHIAWSAFTSSQIQLDPSHHWSLLIQSIYFVITTMSTVGYGDVGPRTLWGQVITILIHLQSLALIIGLFTTLMSYGIRHSIASNAEVSKMET